MFHIQFNIIWIQFMTVEHIIFYVLYIKKILAEKMYHISYYCYTSDVLKCYTKLHFLFIIFLNCRNIP